MTDKYVKARCLSCLFVEETDLAIVTHHAGLFPLKGAVTGVLDQYSRYISARLEVGIV